MCAKRKTPPLFTEEQWASSSLSIVRYYGGATINGQHYRLVNKHGIDIFQLSDPESEYYVGDNNKAIEPGEPADLVNLDWIPLYRHIGRENFIDLLHKYPYINLTEAKKIYDIK